MTCRDVYPIRNAIYLVCYQRLVFSTTSVETVHSHVKSNTVSTHESSDFLDTYGTWFLDKDVQYIRGPCLDVSQYIFNGLHETTVAACRLPID